MKKGITSQILGLIKLGKKVTRTLEAETLSTQLTKLLGSVRYIIVDCSGVEDIDDQALGELAQASQVLAGSGKIILLRPSATFREALRRAELYSMFEISVNWEGAIDKVRKL